MTKVTFAIIHIEDEAYHWRAIPRAVRNALFDRLQEEERESLEYNPPPDRSVYPSGYKIVWRRGSNSYELQYWLVESETINGLEGLVDGEATFIVDVMRPDGSGALKSSLVSSINSISQFVTDWSRQVRVLSAFGIPDAEREKLPELQVITKSQRDAIIDYILDRVLMNK